MKWINIASIAFATNAALVEGFAGSGRVHIGNSPLLHKMPTSSLKPLAFKKPQIFSNHVLRMSDSPISNEDEEIRTKDPIGFIVKEFDSMNINAIINTAVIVGVVVAVLNQLVTVDASIMRGWTASEMAVRIPVDNWLSYTEVLNQSPLSTKAITSATVYTIGDFIAQRLEGLGMGELDRPRLLRSLLAGLIGHGPLSHLWYDFSEHIFDGVFHWNEWWGIFPKVAIDQTTWGPFWNNTYILLLGIMKLEKPDKIFDEMKRTTIPLIVSGLKLWPLCHCITYGVIPVENRLLWVDLVEIVWVTILATAAAGGGGGGAHGAPAPKEEETVSTKAA